MDKFYIDDIVSWTNHNERSTFFGLILPEKYRNQSEKEKEKSSTEKENSESSDQEFDLEIYHAHLRQPLKKEALVNSVFDDSDKSTQRINLEKLNLQSREAIVISDVVQCHSLNKSGVVVGLRRKAMGYVPGHNLFFKDILLDPESIENQFDKKLEIDKPSELIYPYKSLIQEVQLPHDVRNTYFSWKSWLGYLTEKIYTVDLLFQDVAIVQVLSTALLDRFFSMNFNSEKAEQIENLFVGQLLIGDIKSLYRRRSFKFLKETRFINQLSLARLKKKFDVHVLVYKMELKKVSVEWVTNCQQDTTQDSVLPSQVLSDSDLDQMHFFTPIVRRVTQSEHYYFDFTSNIKFYKSTSDNLSLANIFYEMEHSDMSNCFIEVTSSVLNRSDSNNCSKNDLTPPSNGFTIESENGDSLDFSNNQFNLKTQFSEAQKFKVLQDGINKSGKIPIRIVSIHSEILVAWQENSQDWVDSRDCTIIPELVDVHRFFPGDLVQRKLDYELERLQGVNLYGEVLSANEIDRICTVQWFRVSETNLSKVELFEEPEECVVYELLPHSVIYRYSHDSFPLLNWSCINDSEVTNLFCRLVGQIRYQGKFLLEFENGQLRCLPPSVFICMADDFDESSEADLSFFSSQNDESESDEWTTEEELPVGDDSQLLDKANDVTPFLEQSMIQLLRIRSNHPSKEKISEIIKTISSDNATAGSQMPGLTERQLIRLGQTIMSDLSRVHHSISRALEICDDERFMIFMDDADLQSKCADYARFLAGTVLEDVDKIHELSVNFVTELCEMNQQRIMAWIYDVLGSQKASDISEKLQLCLNDNKEHSNGQLISEIDFKDAVSVQNCGDGHSVENMSIDEQCIIEESKNDEVNTESPLPQQLSSVASANFEVLEECPTSHKFITKNFQPSAALTKAIFKEVRLLSSSIPDGVWIHHYSNRADLFSVAIAGPVDTPYEYCLLFFDIYLPSTYPLSPPEVFFISYCEQKINPNLYNEGRVCLSLLGTWFGRGSENWSSESSLLQLIVSIQGLILVEEPYYCEAGYERNRGSLETADQSRRYNEMVLVNVANSTRRLLKSPSANFEKIVTDFYLQHSANYIKWLENILEAGSSQSSSSILKFSLFPCSKGFLISMRKALENLKISFSSLKLLFTKRDNLTDALSA